MAQPPKPLESGADPMPEDTGSPVQAGARGASETETQDPDAIARRAYEKFQSRGGEHGRHEEDWLEAERELNKPSGE